MIPKNNKDCDATVAFFNERPMEHLSGEWSRGWLSRGFNHRKELRHIRYLWNCTKISSLFSVIGVTFCTYVTLYWLLWCFPDNKN